jgi:hypothetical protein
MWMTAYIKEIQRQFVEVYNFTPRSDAPLIPRNVPDGEYPMAIEGKVDRVRVENGFISCCNFEESA